jgi:hypothetical protein
MNKTSLAAKFNPHLHLIANPPLNLNPIVAKAGG